VVSSPRRRRLRSTWRYSPQPTPHHRMSHTIACHTHAEPRVHEPTHSSYPATPSHVNTCRAVCVCTYTQPLPGPVPGAPLRRAEHSQEVGRPTSDATEYRAQRKKVAPSAACRLYAQLPGARSSAHVPWRWPVCRHPVRPRRGAIRPYVGRVPSRPTPAWGPHTAGCESAGTVRKEEDEELEEEDRGGALSCVVTRRATQLLGATEIVERQRGGGHFVQQCSSLEVGSSASGASVAAAVGGEGRAGRPA
jgi:hypothetical protein